MRKISSDPQAAPSALVMVIVSNMSRPICQPFARFYPLPCIEFKV